ncbi:hypothetical protein CVT26_007357 [Gymnopilus dilepis]|uniref:Uncharacterized protein n=1 Tax=Gymnopilus dilepis TaxID=231916 RepID=A0A409VP98_9AGAR|nr:hypothetical protein CVT26_007357 [Gymnopilus dilepis]
MTCTPSVDSYYFKPLEPGDWTIDELDGEDEDVSNQRHQAVSNAHAAPMEVRMLARPNIAY